MKLIFILIVKMDFTEKLTNSINEKTDTFYFICFTTFVSCLKG